MDKNYLRNYIDNALACESELYRIKRRLKDEVRGFIRAYNRECGRKETELVIFGNNDDIFYDYVQGRNLDVDGVRVLANGEIALHLVDGDMLCGLNDDGDTNIESLIEALNTLIED